MSDRDDFRVLIYFFDLHLDSLWELAPPVGPEKKLLTFKRKRL